MLEQAMKKTTRLFSHVFGIPNTTFMIPRRRMFVLSTTSNRLREGVCYVNLVSGSVDTMFARKMMVFVMSTSSNRTPDTIFAMGASTHPHRLYGETVYRRRGTERGLVGGTGKP